MLVSEIIDRTFNEWLLPAGVDRPAIDFLADAITAASPAAGGTFNVDGLVESIPPSSVLEVDSELILTRSVALAQITVAERGYLNTVPADHADGSQVRVDTKYPRVTLLNHLRSVVGMLRPWGLYWRDVDTTNTFTTREALDLPAGAKRILAIVVRSTGSLERYQTFRREGQDWILHREFTPPKFHIRRGGTEGGDMRVVYTKDFTLPTLESDDLDNSGVPETLQSYLPMAVAGMALSGREIPRVQLEEIRRMLATNGIQVGSALNVGRAMLNAFRLEYVMAERRRQTEEDPPLLVWARTE